MVALEVQVKENDQSFPQEMPFLTDCAFQACHADVTCLLVAHQHLCFYAMIIQRIHQSVGRNGCATRLFTCIYYQYFHCIDKGTNKRGKSKGKTFFFFFFPSESTLITKKTKKNSHAVCVGLSVLIR